MVGKAVNQLVFDMGEWYFEWLTSPWWLSSPLRFLGATKYHLTSWEIPELSKGLEIVFFIELGFYSRPCLTSQRFSRLGIAPATRRTWSASSMASTEDSGLPIFAKMISVLSHQAIQKTGWWFGTFFIFHNIWDNPSHWLVFFRGVETTNQKIMIWIYAIHTMRFWTSEVPKYHNCRGGFCTPFKAVVQ